MDREKALELLRGGADGVKEWNRQRREREDISDLSRAIIDRKDITAGIQVLAASCFAAILLACLAAVALADAPKATEELTGKVIAVTDGDTINVLVNEETVKVRLEGIDAPESGQSYGKKSKEALAEMVAPFSSCESISMCASISCSFFRRSMLLLSSVSMGWLESSMRTLLAMVPSWRMMSTMRLIA